jgi:hypothetical protein
MRRQTVRIRGESGQRFNAVHGRKVRCKVKSKQAEEGCKA